MSNDEAQEDPLAETKSPQKGLENQIQIRKTRDVGTNWQRKYKNRTCKHRTEKG